jgi:hypothetical protein
MGVFMPAKGTPAKRPDLVVLGDVSSSGEDLNKWEVLGIRTPDASLSLDMDTETTTDILGNTYTTQGKPELSIEFDPLPVIGGSKILESVYNYYLNRNWDKLSNQRILVIYRFAGVTNDNPALIKYDAQLWPSCTITPGDWGGESDEPLNMSITVHFGGEPDVGNVVISGTEGNWVYTFEKTANPWPPSSLLQNVVPQRNKINADA